MKSLYPYTLASLALFAAFPALAADAPADAVVVTATRFVESDPGVAANVSVITRQDIRNTPAQNLPDVLSTRAGVAVTLKRYDALNHATTLGALAWPLRGLAPVLDDITAFIAAAPENQQDKIPA